MKLSDKKSVTAFINSGKRHIQQSADAHGRITADVSVLVDAIEAEHTAKEKSETAPAELARVYSAFSKQYHSCFDAETAKRKWNSFVTITGRKCKEKGFKPVPQKVQDQGDGDGIQYIAVNIVKHVETASSGNSGNSGTRRNNNGAGGNTRPGIKTVDECRAAMAAWVRQKIITETQLFDMACSLFASEADMRKAFAGSGFLTKHQTAVKVSAAVKKQQETDKRAYAAELARANERAKNAAIAAQQIEERSA